MTETIDQFFADLTAKGHFAQLKYAEGSIRFDLEHNGTPDHWFLTMSGGDITVTRDEAPADAVIRADRALFGRIITGEVNGMAALLRGAIDAEGDPLTLLRFQRLLPGPPTAHRPATTVAEARP